MANPQVEDGHIKIAKDLFVAIIGAGFTSLEYGVVFVVMYFTYGADRKKAEIGLEDFRLMMTGNKRVRSDRLAESVENLVRRRVLFRQEIAAERWLYGIQKDFDKWVLNGKAPLEEVDKMSASINRSINNINNNTSLSAVDKMSIMVIYGHKAYQGTYSLGSYRVELKHAKQLYKQALLLTRDPQAAAQSIKDYIDDLNSQEWFSQCKLRFVYMNGRFRAWYKAAPTKPKNIKDQEEVTGYRFTYNRKTKQWEMTNART